MTTAPDKRSWIWNRLAELTSHVGFYEYHAPPEEEIIKQAKRKQKSIDRAAWAAEANQRFAKGGHWK